MLTYSLILHGLREGALPGALVADLLSAVDRGARGSVRLRMEGRSTARGGVAPGWLNQAAAFQVVGLMEDVAGVRLAAPSLAEAVPERFAQADFFPRLDPSASGLTLLGESLREALEGNEESVRFDEPLLEAFEDFRRVLRGGVTSVEIRNGRRGPGEVTVTPEGMRTVRRLHRQTPAPQKVRVAGKVEVIRHSDLAFVLVLATGEKIPGLLAAGDPQVLTNHWGRDAVVTGIAHFRPSGTLLRVDAELIHPAGARDLEAWSSVPRSLFGTARESAAARPAGTRGGLNALFGAWPGDESDDEVTAWLEELS
jgi:hypothetical protein